MDSGAVARDRQQVQEAGSSCKRQGQEAVCRSRDRKQAVKEVYSISNGLAVSCACCSNFSLTPNFSKICLQANIIRHQILNTHTKITHE